MDNKKFIITTNDESASLLIQTGFHLVSQNGKQWTFLNDNKMLFNNLSDVVYSDKLFIWLLIFYLRRITQRKEENLEEILNYWRFDWILYEE
mgnify:FL=1